MSAQKTFIKVRQGFFMSLTLGLTLATAISATLEPSSAKTVSTPKMEVVFEDGWLVRWVNKETGEQIEFGKDTLDPAANRPYLPGQWLPEWKVNTNKGSVAISWKDNLEQIDEVTAAYQQTVRCPGNEAMAVQWALRLPLDKIDAFHFPQMAPARVISKDQEIDGLFARGSYYFNDRPGVLSFHQWRQRYYLVQGKTGGLLIYMDDPDFEHRPALEFRNRPGETVICNRSIKPAPFKEEYTGGRWIIRQYTGWVNVGAQIYQDYLVKTYQLVPVKDRPTAWVGRLAFCITKPPWCFPLPYEGKQSPAFNYSSKWQESMKAHEEWLQNLAKVIDPDKVMFYFTYWKPEAMDINYPNHSPDPFFFHMVRKARKMGFHVCLHFHNHMIHEHTTFCQRFLFHQSLLLGMDPAKGVPFGVGDCVLRDQPMIQKDKNWGAFGFSLGLQSNFVVQTSYHMHPGYEGWRYMKVAELVGAIRETGADMIHLDVPSIWMDKNNERYGLNMAQGLREMYRLLRKTLDEENLQNVAILTECTPSEPILPYVDMAQVSRDRSVMGVLVGEKEDELVELQTGQDLKKIEAQRAKKKDPSKTFSLVQTREKLGKWRVLGEPAVESMVNGPYVLGYPHLGVIGPEEADLTGDDLTRAQVIQGLAVWYGLTHNTLWHTGSGYDFGKPETIPEFQKVKVALARFWAANLPQLMEPKHWERGDVARYQLKDGRVLRVVRSTPTTLRLVFQPGEVLADLDLFEGWKGVEKLKTEFGVK